MLEKRSVEAIQLEKEIRIHDQSYWIDNRATVSDVVYDQIVKRLLQIEPDNEYLNRPKAPKVDSQGKVHHSVPMLSLDKAYEWEEILKFCKRTARNDSELYKLMYKFDGISGQFMFNILASRGDGEVGENITHKLPFMNILTNGDPNNMRGEILFTKSKFAAMRDQFTRKGGEKYKNERNAVQGILGRDDITPSKILHFIDFEYVCYVLTWAVIKDLGKEKWDNFCKEAKDSNFPTDGLVLKVADEKYAKSLGSTRHHSKSAIAFKFDNPFEWTVLREVIFSAGKHDITPVGKVDPVEINGVTIVSPSLHNWKNIIDRDLHIGDEVKLERAGDVIPYISDSRPGENRTSIVIPPCPICGFEVIYVEPQLECSNLDCPGKLLNKLSDAVIRIGIDRLGKPTIEKMMDTLKVENLVDIFNVTKSDLLKLERSGETSAMNLLSEINKVKTEGVFDWQLLACLNIPGIGRTLSKDLLTGRTLPELECMTQSELEALPNIGSERAIAIIEGLIVNQDLLIELHKILPIKTREVFSKDLIKVCFTGSFPEPKRYYYKLLEVNGGYEILEKMKDVDILVVADSSKESNKTKVAKKKGIKIIGIDELIGGL